MSAHLTQVYQDAYAEALRSGWAPSEAHQIAQVAVRETSR